MYWSCDEENQNLLKIAYTQQTQNICITFIQRRPNVFAVGPTLYKCYTNVLCLLGKLYRAGIDFKRQHLTSTDVGF